MPMSLSKCYLEKTSDTNVWPRDNMLQEKILNRPIYIDEKSRSIVNILCRNRNCNTRKQARESCIY